MRKFFKNILLVATAAVLTAGSLSIAACGSGFTPHADMPPKDAEIASNGGFVVSVGDENGYYYFINGVETYTADNTYGSPVKGALMQVKKKDVAEGNGEEVKTVVPSLMAAGDYTAGIFIYGDRVYYATPTNIRNTSGVIENGYLDFKSAKLDGSDVKDVFRTTSGSSNATVYRFVKVENTVYLIYVEGSSSYTLHSVNTETGKDTMLAKNVSQYVLDSADKENPYIYYRMGVTDKADSDGAQSLLYQQIYRVRADATKAPGGYLYGNDDFANWDREWLDENNAGVIPYINLGELVLDGRGKSDKDGGLGDGFSHSDSEPLSPIGYKYDLRSYKTYPDGKGGLYFTRTGTNDKGGDLYFLPVSEIEGAGWDSVEGNKTDGTGKLQKVAGAAEATSHATTSAYFYVKEETGANAAENCYHHYLYVSDSCIYRVDVRADGRPNDPVQVAYGVGSATIIDIDMTSDDAYSYVYYAQSDSNGLSVERAVFNGDEEDYRNLPYIDGGTEQKNTAYRAQKVLSVSHASGWYNYEVLDGYVFYADAESFGSTSYKYVSTVDLKNSDGSLMDNVELAEWNKTYSAIVDTADKTSLYAKLNDVFGDSDLSSAFKYYFYTGESSRFEDNIREAVSYGQTETSLYTQEEQDAFRAYVKGEAYETSQGKAVFAAGERATYSDFRTQLGKWSDADLESYATYWKTSGLRYYTPPEKEESGLAWWAWLLIAIAIVVVAVFAACGTYMFLTKRKKKNEPKKEKPKVITADNRDIDVYSDENAEPDVPDAHTEELEDAEEEPEAAFEETPEEAPEEAPAAPAEAPEGNEHPEE